MIDTKDLRRMVNAAQFESFANSVINSLLDRLEAAEKERDALRIENEALRAEIIHIKEVEFPRKAQAVADGWRGKCERLEAKITEMERQEPVAWMLNCPTLGGDTGWILSWTQSGAGLCNRLQGEENEKRLYALPGAQPAPSAPSEEAAAEMGANGGHVVEAERLAFEAWMRGHCWKLGAKWTGTEYRSAFEKGGMVDTHAMRTRELWAAWRDRAALAAPKPEAKP